MIAELWKLLLTLAAVSLATGCATTTSIAIPTDAVRDLEPASTCDLQVTLVDHRQSKHLGYLADKEFVFPDYFEYLDRQLRSRFVGEKSSPRIHVQLLRAYLETNRQTLSFNTVLRAYREGESNSQGKIHRGETTKVNWFGSDSELGAYIERATRDAVEKIAQGEGCFSGVRSRKARSD